jgi:hypothetical protein
MPFAPMSLIEKAAEFLPLAESTRVPAKTRGLYLLLKKQRARNRYEVVYVGMACGPLAGIRGAYAVIGERNPDDGRTSLFSKSGTTCRHKSCESSRESFGTSIGRTPVST